MFCGVCFASLTATAQTPPVFTDEGKVKLQGQEFEIFPPELMRAKGMEVPEIPDEQNAAWVYVQAMNALTPVPTELNDAFQSAQNGQWPEGEAGPRLAEWVEQNRPAIALATNASRMPQHYMPFFRGESDSLIAALLPSLGPSRQLARLLSADAAYQMTQGNSAAAVENLLTAQRMANQVGGGHTLIEGLVGIAISSLATSSLEKIAASEHADAETLKAAAAEMDALSGDMPTFEEMVRAEQAWAGGFIDDVMDMPGGPEMVFSNYAVMPPRVEPNGWQRLLAALSRVYIPDRAVKRHFNDHYDRLVEATKPKDGGFGEIVEEEKLFENIPPWDFIARSMVPSLGRVHETTLMAQSNAVRAQLRLATEAYRAEKGAYPTSLSALVPSFLSEVPADPMTGYDFDYQPGAGDAAHGGLSQITRESAEELRKKRRTPAILNPRASKWRRMVTYWADSHSFDAVQRAAADAILRDIEARASAFEQSHGATIQSMLEKGNNADAEVRMKPLDDLFKELMKRLDTLPTAKQREQSRRP
ncbi:MAG TPA: hypothetical protein VNT79_05535 [Phycisphaerae bacterium]|nr:hypothetical protein [Phycisphaerae bacterium]